MSLEDSLHHSNDGIMGKFRIGGLRTQPFVVMTNWPWYSHTLQLLKIEQGSGDRCSQSPGQRLRGIAWQHE